MKKSISALTSILVAIVIAAGCAFASFADEVDYGTFEKGFISSDNNTSGWNFYKYTPTEKFMNGNFEEGFKYWTSNSFEKDTKRIYWPNETFELQEDAGNHYIKLTATNEWQGIVSPRFKVEGVQPGQMLVPIYDWKGEPTFQIVLQQWIMNADGKGGVEQRIALGNNKIIKEAASDSEWNTQFSYKITPREDGTVGVVQPEEGKDPTLYFTMLIQASTDPKADVSLDNFRLGIYRDKENKIYDVDGKTVLYDLSALEDEAVEEEVEEDEEYFDLEEEEEDENLSTETAKKSESKGLGWLLYVIIAAGVVVLAAAAVVVVLVVKKKKSAEKAPISENTDTVTDENQDAADSTQNDDESKSDHGE